MDSVSLQSKRTMQKLMGTAPGNVYCVRHNKRGLKGGERPLTFTNLRNARVHATSWARDEEDNKEISIVEYELIEVQTHTRLKQRGGL